MHFATVFIIYHQCLLIYSLFGRYILFSVFMLIFGIVQTCVYCPWSTKLTVKYFTILCYIFTSMNSLSISWLLVIFVLGNTYKFLLHKDFTFGMHIYPFTSMTTYGFLIWQTYFSFLVYTITFWNCTHMCIYPKN